MRGALTIRDTRKGSIGFMDWPEIFQVKNNYSLTWNGQLWNGPIQDKQPVKPVNQGDLERWKV